MRLPEEVITYCLRYLRRDLPTLMSTLNALDEWSLIEKANHSRYAKNDYS